MVFNRYFTPFFSLLSVIALLHYFALREAYYWTVPWYDIMMHFLGGLWVVLAILWFSRTHFIPYSDFAKSTIALISMVVVVGLLWEIYEVVFGLTFISDPEYLGDTTIDLIMDVVGGFLGTLTKPKRYE